MNRIVLLEYLATADDVHIKYFHPRQPPELSSNLQAREQSMPGIDYDSAINVHICCNSVPGHAGGYVPGMSVAYKNQV